MQQIKRWLAFLVLMIVSLTTTLQAYAGVPVATDSEVIYDDELEAGSESVWIPGVGEVYDGMPISMEDYLAGIYEFGGPGEYDIMPLANVSFTGTNFFYLVWDYLNSSGVVHATAQTVQDFCNSLYNASNYGGTTGQSKTYMTKTGAKVAFLSAAYLTMMKKWLNDVGLQPYTSGSVVSIPEDFDSAMRYVYCSSSSYGYYAGNTATIVPYEDVAGFPAVYGVYYSNRIVVFHFQSIPLGGHYMDYSSGDQGLSFANQLSAVGNTVKIPYCVERFDCNSDTGAWTRYGNAVYYPRNNEYVYEEFINRYMMNNFPFPMFRTREVLRDYIGGATGVLAEDRFLNPYHKVDLENLPVLEGTWSGDIDQITAGTGSIGGGTVTPPADFVNYDKFISNSLATCKAESLKLLVLKNLKEGTYTAYMCTDDFSVEQVVDDYYTVVVPGYKYADTLSFNYVDQEHPSTVTRKEDGSVLKFPVTNSCVHDPPEATAKTIMYLYGMDALAYGDTTIFGEQQNVEPGTGEGTGDAAISGALGKIITYLDSMSKSITPAALAAAVASSLGLDSKFTGLTTAVTGIPVATAQAVSQALDWDSVTGTFTSIDARIADLGDVVTTIPQTLVDIRDNIGTIPGSIADLGDVVTTIPQTLVGIQDKVTDIPAEMTAALTQAQALADAAAKAEAVTDVGNQYHVQSDFSRKFPFCVPFDLIDCVRVLESTRTAPRWEIPFEIESLGVHEKVVIDLSTPEWEHVTQIARLFLLLFFILGLVLLTRNLIKG